jgi:thiol-disulfide isomerase/thioredoxin
MNRRALVLLGGAGLIAAGAGAAWSLRRAGSALNAAETQLWGMSFAQPQGGTLAMASLRGQPLLLNFWATWCPPCLREMPMLDRFYRERRAAGWRVVGLAVDGAEPVRAYLAHLPMTFPIGVAGMEGIELAGKLGNTGGALPFTVVFDQRGKAVDHHLGGVEKSHLARWDQRLVAD